MQIHAFISKPSAVVSLFLSRFLVWTEMSATRLCRRWNNEVEERTDELDAARSVAARRTESVLVPLTLECHSFDSRRAQMRQRTRRRKREGEVQRWIWKFYRNWFSLFALAVYERKIDESILPRRELFSMRPDWSKKFLWAKLALLFHRTDRVCKKLITLPSKCVFESKGETSAEISINFWYVFAFQL